jgi:hypothetical protein
MTKDDVIQMQGEVVKQEYRARHISGKVILNWLHLVSTKSFRRMQ